MSRISSGSSSATARPTVSLLSTTPGPAEVETPSEPPKLAPSAAPTAAISSSAWKVRTPKFLWRLRAARREVAGGGGGWRRGRGEAGEVGAAGRPRAGGARAAGGRG